MWDFFQIFTTLCGLKLFRRSNNAWRRKFCVEDVSAWEDYIFHVPESLDFSWHWHHSWLFLQSSENVGNAFSMIYCINTSFFINNKLIWSRLDTCLMFGREVIHRRFYLSKTKVVIFGLKSWCKIFLRFLLRRLFFVKNTMTLNDLSTEKPSKAPSRSSRRFSR